jgi:hypothetical protein
MQKYVNFKNDKQGLEEINSLLEQGWKIVDKNVAKSKEVDTISLLLLLEKENDNSEVAQLIQKMCDKVAMEYVDKTENALKLKQIIITNLKENNVCTEQIENIVNSLEIDDFVIGVTKTNVENTNEP